MNWHATIREPFFETTRYGGGPGADHHREMRRFGHEPRNLTEIFRVIRGDADSAVGLKGAVDGREKSVGDETAAGVASLRPGIGEHDMKRSDGIFGQQVFDHIRNFEPQDTSVR